LKSFLPRASYSLFLRLDDTDRCSVDEAESGFETRSFPNSLVAYPGDFTFYVARPGRSVHSRAKASSVGRQTAPDLGQPPRLLPLGHGAHDE